MKNAIRYIAVLPACILLSVAAFTQTIKKLEDNNGFKKYKLGSKYLSLYGIKNPLPDGSDKVAVMSSWEKIGDIPVQNIELIYIRDTLARILVRMEPRYNVPLLEASKNSFGPFTFDSSDNETTRKLNKPVASKTVFKDRYIWKGRKMNLEYYHIYPQYTGDAYSNRDLQLVYSLNDYSIRLRRASQKRYSAKDF